MSHLTYRTATPTAPGETTLSSPGLSNDQIDGNFKSLDAGKVEVDDCVSTATANKVVKRDVNGDFAANIISVVDMNSTSDRRLKENIINIHDGLAIVNSLQGVRFNFKDRPETKVGLIAQDVQSVLPEVVMKMAGEDTLTIGYQNIVAVLIEAVKDLSTQVNELRCIVNTNNNIIRDLANEITRIS